MKVILEFQIPDEQTEYELAINGAKYNYILTELDEQLRKVTKYGDDEPLLQFKDSDTTVTICTETVWLVRRLLSKIKQDRGISEI